MTGRRLQSEELDRLLRETLRDSPAPGEEDRLRSDIRRAWAEARSARPAVVPSIWLFVPPLARAALGIAAGLVLALGLAFHLAFPPRLVADSLAGQASSLRAIVQLRRATAMECVLDTTDDAGRPRRFHVGWRAPDEARVRLEDPDGATWARRVPSVRAGLLSVASPVAGVDDPRFAPVRDVLSPDRVAALLNGRRPLRVTFDRVTGLPVRLEAGWTAVLGFRLAEETPLPLAGPTGSGR